MDPRNSSEIAIMPTVGSVYSRALKILKINNQRKRRDSRQNVDNMFTLKITLESGT